MEAGLGCYFIGVQVHPSTGLSDDVMEATLPGNLTRFINHSTIPNCFVEETEQGPVLLLVVFAKNHIRAGQQLTF